MTRTLTVLYIALFTALTVQAAEPEDQLPAPPDGRAWKLIWNDEFDGIEIDKTKWEVRPYAVRKGGWWSPDAVSLDGKGNLVITAFQDGDKYVDGCVWTKGLFEHAFGYYVCRAKFQKQPGHWTAFWINGRDIGKVDGSGRDGTEIDIMEKPWLDNRVQHAFHWDGYGDAHQSVGEKVEVPGVMQGYHTFALHWTPDEYIFYIDGRETWRSTAGGVCQNPQYMLLSDEIGTWAGDITRAKLPDQFFVDYVRVYDLVEEPK